MDPIATLLSHPLTKLTEEHRPWLEKLDPQQIELLTPNAVPEPEPQEPTTLTLDEALARLSDADKATVQIGLKANEDRRTALITTITGNSANKFTAEQLGAMPTETLEAVAELAKAQPPAPTPINANKEEGLGLPWRVPAPTGTGLNANAEETPLECPGLTAFMTKQ